MAEKIVEAISEETLDKVAGGLKVDKGTVKKVLAGAGVVILSAAAVAGGGTLVAGKFGKGPAKGLFSKGKENAELSATTSASADVTGDAFEDAQRDYMNEREDDI